LLVKVTAAEMLDEASRGMLSRQSMQTIDAMARTPAERLRAIIVAGELEGAEEALRRLDERRVEWGEGEDALARDAGALERVYREGAASLDEGERRLLEERHGWFGRLALARPGEADDARRDLLAGGRAILVWGLLVSLGVMGAALAGTALLITGVVLGLMGRLRARFEPPAPGGSVYIETLAVFIGGFLLLQGLGQVVAAGWGEGAALRATLGAQWLLLLAALWPMARGSGWRRHAAAMGWTRGRGVLREVGCGVAGYLASLPVYFGAAVVVWILSALRSLGASEPAPGPENPALELVSQARGVWTLVLLGALAVVWAPLVEESVFRGATYRSLRGRVGWPIAGLGCGLVFAALHRADAVLLPMYVSLGFMFSVLREWRGSLIAPITAHAIHNALALTVAVGLVRLAGA
jgi:membrane protease YdiL (CAAX protease family)